MSLSFQQELRLSGSKRERGPHACHLHFPQRSKLLATGLAGPPPPALVSIQVHSPGASQMLASRLQGAGLARGTGRGQGSSCSFRQWAQCCCSGSDFPRNSLEQRTIISQLRAQTGDPVLRPPHTARLRRTRSLEDHIPTQKTISELNEDTNSTQSNPDTQKERPGYGLLFFILNFRAIVWPKFSAAGSIYDGEQL